jgi:hypothetical protein
MSSLPLFIQWLRGKVTVREKNEQSVEMIAARVAEENEPKRSKS